MSLYDGTGNIINVGSEGAVGIKHVEKYINLSASEVLNGTDKGYKISDTTFSIVRSGSTAWGVIAFDVSKYTKIIVNANTAYALFFNCNELSDCSASTVVGEKIELPNTDAEINIPENAKLLAITCYHASSKRISIVSEMIDELILTNDPIPDYAINNIVEKVASANAVIKQNGITDPTTVDQFLFFTDYHFNPLPVLSDTDNTKHSASAMRYVMNHSGASKILFGGDIENAVVGTQDEFYACMSDFDETFGELRKTMYCVLGNHEHNCTERLTNAQLCQFLNKYVENQFDAMSNRGDFYIDDDTKKIRYIGVMASSRWSEHTDSTIADDSIEWLASTFDTVPNGYTVFIYTHLLAEMDVNEDGSFKRYYSSGNKHDSVEIINMLDAVKAKSTYGSHDYSDVNCIIACVMTGHWHYDGSYTTPGGIPIIVTTSDSCRRRRIRVDESGKWIRGGEDGENLVGTVDEQAFDIVTINTSNRKIYCTRVGYGEDREYSY